MEGKKGGWKDGERDVEWMEGSHFFCGEKEGRVEGRSDGSSEGVR